MSRYSSNKLLTDLSASSLALELVSDDGGMAARVAAVRSLAGKLDFNDLAQMHMSQVLYAPATEEIGSGLLLDDRGLLKIVTAAHLLEATRDPDRLTRLVVARRLDLGDPIADISIASPIEATDIGQSTTKRDHDTAVVFLNPIQTDELLRAGYRPFPVDRISANPPTVGDAIGAVHFPHSLRDTVVPNPEGRRLRSRPIPPILDRESEFVARPVFSEDRVVTTGGRFSATTLFADVEPGSSGGPVINLDDGTLFGLIMAVDPPHANSVQTYVSRASDIIQLLPSK